MLEYLKKILNNENYKRILENIISLFSLQGLTYILPIITFPYLTRVLGPEKYGLIAFATSFVAYFQILTDYGFNLSATREVSINRNDKKKLSKIFCSVISTKIILMILSLVLMTLIIFSFETFRNNWILYYFTFGLVIGNLLLPSWFFQGMEKMQYISILNIIISLIFTFSIFLLIKQSSDYILVPLINTISTLIIGIIAIILIRRNFKINFITPSINDIIYQMKEGWHAFISTVAILFYSNSNIFILGILTNNVIVGYYYVADRIAKMIIALIGPISGSIYPYISSMAKKSKKDSIKFIKKIAVFLGLLTFISSILLYFGSTLIVTIFAGDQFSQSVILLKIFSFLPFIIAMSNVFGVLFLFAFGYSKQASRVQIIIGLIYPFILIPMTFYLKDIGTALSFVIVETMVTLAFWILYKKKYNELIE